MSMPIQNTKVPTFGNASDQQSAQIVDRREEESEDRSRSGAIKEEDEDTAKEDEEYSKITGDNKPIK